MTTVRTVDSPFGYLTGDGYIGAIEVSLNQRGELYYTYRFFATEEDYLEWFEENKD